MLPTSPRLASRSMSSSCTTPEPATATRVSCGVTLIRTSSLTQLVEQLAGLVQRQPHDARVAAAQLDDEAGGTALDGVGAGLVVALAGGDVEADLLLRERLQPHLRARHPGLDPVAVLERRGSEHLVGAA